MDHLLPLALFVFNCRTAVLIRFTHVSYFRVSQSSDEAICCGMLPTPKRCGNVAIRMRQEDELGSDSSDTTDLKFLGVCIGGDRVSS